MVPRKDGKYIVSCWKGFRTCFLLMKGLIMKYAEFVLSGGSGLSTISDAARCIDYKTLKHEIAGLCEKLRILGISESETIGIMFDNRIEFLISILAVNLLGAKAVPIYYATGSQKLRDIVLRYKVKCILCAGPEIESVNDLITCSYTYGNMLHVHVLNFCEQIGEIADSGVLLMLTSGTTHEPKCVVLTDENIIASVGNIADYLNLTESDKMLVLKNVIHISTLVGELLVGLRCGCSIHFSNRLLVGSYVEREVCAKGITSLFITPSIFRDILPSLNNALHYLRLIHLSGEMLQTSLVKQFNLQAPHVKLLSGYGLTEAAPRITQIDISDFLSHPGSVGKPIGDQQLRIINGDGNCCDNYEVGEILVKGSNIMQGYLREGKLVPPPEGWLHTGDLGYVDEEGFLYINGRKDNMFIIFGRNIYPEEIEGVISSYPGVEEVLVCKTLFEDKYRIIARIVTNSQISIPDLLMHCRNNLEDYKVPARIELVKTLPKTISGKLARALE